MVDVSQFYSVKSWKKSVLLFQWMSCGLLFSAGVALLAAHIFTDNMLTFINVALYMCWGELLIAGIRWGGREDNWPSIVAGGWLLACSLGVWDFSGQIYSTGPSYAATVWFLWLLLVGYLALRAGMFAGFRARGLSMAIEEACRSLSPEFLAPRSFRYSLFALGLCSCVGLCFIYAYFGSIPLLSDNPPLARYQFFNGPFTKNMFRFFFRVCAATSMIASMYLVVLINKDFSVNEKIATVITVVLTLLCALASGSRGDFSVLMLFIGIRAIFIWPTKKRLVPALVACSVCVTAFCILTISRIKDGLGSLSSVFPELADGALLTRAAKVYDVPLAWGKTYLSALLSFVPSSVFPFRETYGFGRYSLEILYLGDDSPIAPTYGGLRPTFVGEAYLNGGIIGVILFGLVLGICLGAWRARQGTIKLFSGGWVVFFLLSLLTVMVSDFYGIFHGLLLVVGLVWAVEKLLKRSAC